MEYVTLGKTGLKVSRICLGCMTYGAPATGELKGGRHAWALNEEESQPYFRQALDLGVNFFDTANVYSSGASEEVLGNFLKTNARREAVVVATKVYGSMRDEPNGGGLSRKAIFHELEDSLRRLRTDYVDLYQIHRWDYGTPIEETLEALHDTVKSGKVRYILALLPCSHGNSRNRFIWLISTDGPVSFRCRIITICSIAKKNAK
jgi:1-deoxyxylulose-5-phosphate synthase